MDSSRKILGKFLEGPSVEEPPQSGVLGTRVPAPSTIRIAPPLQFACVVSWRVDARFVSLRASYTIVCVWELYGL